MAASTIYIQDETFLKYLNNTIQDFKNTNRIDMVNSLREIQTSKKLTLINIMKLVELILVREENKDSILLQQDKKTYDLINEEHLYMKSYLNKYFSFSAIKGSSLIEIVRK